VKTACKRESGVQELRNEIGGVPVHPLGDVGVQVQRDADVGVAESLADHLGVDAGE
jgi:hypothetical protein